MPKINLILVIIASIVAFPALAQETTQLELTQSQQATYDQLQAQASNLNVSWDERAALPDWVRMTNLAIDWRSEDYTERAYQFLVSNSVIRKN